MPTFVVQSYHMQEAYDLAVQTGFSYAACLRLVTALEGK